MCIGIPVQVIEAGELVSVCRGLNGVEEVNMMLIGSQPVGTWVLNFLGSAREILSEKDAFDINRALQSLQAIRTGSGEFDADVFFSESGG